MSSHRAQAGTFSYTFGISVSFFACFGAQTVSIAGDTSMVNPFNAPICQKRKPMTSGDGSEAAAMPQMSVMAEAVVAGGAPRKIKFYRNPMGLADMSPIPKKDEMGMDYIPVYEDEDKLQHDQFGISPVKIQRTGIELTVASRHEISSSLRAPATIELDEQRVFVVAPRFEGFIETAGEATTGAAVKKGEVLATAYSPEIVNRGTWLLIDVNTNETAQPALQRTGASLAKPLITPVRRLQELGAPDEFIEEIKRERRVPGTVTIRAPRDGVVLERNASAGQALKSGDPIFRIADLSSVWVMADVPEAELEGLQAGQDAKITARAFPGHVMHGTVSVVYPEISRETRTARVRIELANEDLRLKPGMYADVEFAKGVSQPAVTVPMGAVLDSGARQTVFLSLPEGRFEAREVKTGRRGDGRVEILTGLAEGDRIVANGNFLIDAESNLQSAIKTFSATSNAEARR